MRKLTSTVLLACAFGHHRVNLLSALDRNRRKPGQFPAYQRTACTLADLFNHHRRGRQLRKSVKLRRDLRLQRLEHDVQAPHVILGLRPPIVPVIEESLL
jgi:hypothetical protein